MSTASKNKTPVILLFGPTASGKTSLVERLFSHGYEIINADSQQVYKHLRIGTAKPSRSLLEKIPHHLVDLLDPRVQFSVGSFVKEADRAIVNIRRRGRIPVITGGTAYYFQHFIYGMPPAPQADAGVRDKLSRRLLTEGLEALWKELLENDPVRAARLHPNDTQRIVRALEVFHTSGRPLSSYQTRREPRPQYTCFSAGLCRERTELYHRINERVEEMWSEGLPDEFRGLLRMGYSSVDPGMRGIGYREFFLMRDSGEYTFQTVKEEIKKNSRRYAKRQITFFKKIPDVAWFHPDSIDAIRDGISAFLDLLE